MRVITLRTLRQYWERHSDAEEALRSWYQDAQAAKWKTPEDVKTVHRNASVVAGNRIVFNIKGNQYRLIVAIHYNTGFVYIRFVGSHQEYDKVDAATV